MSADEIFFHTAKDSWGNIDGFIIPLGKGRFQYSPCDNLGLWVMVDSERCTAIKEIDLWDLTMLKR